MGVQLSTTPPNDLTGLAILGGGTLVALALLGYVLWSASRGSKSKTARVALYCLPLVVIVNLSFSVFFMGNAREGLQKQNLQIVNEHYGTALERLPSSDGSYTFEHEGRTLTVTRGADDRVIVLEGNQEYQPGA